MNQHIDENLKNAFIPGVKFKRHPNHVTVLKDKIYTIAFPLRIVSGNTTEDLMVYTVEEAYVHICNNGKDWATILESNPVISDNPLIFN